MGCMSINHPDILNFINAKQDPADNAMEFIGEERIDHTPKDEDLSLYIGNAFDVEFLHDLTPR